MTNRIKKRIEKMETVDTDYEDRGDENGVYRACSVH